MVKRNLSAEEKRALDALNAPAARDAMRLLLTGSVDRPPLEEEDPLYDPAQDHLPQSTTQAAIRRWIASDGPRLRSLKAIARQFGCKERAIVRWLAAEPEWRAMLQTPTSSKRQLRYDLDCATMGAPFSAFLAHARRARQSAALQREAEKRKK